MLWAEAIPVSEAARNMGDRITPLEHALGDGEDFELVFAESAEEGRRLVHEQPVLGVTLRAIGECVAAGLWIEDSGKRRPLAALGWVHEMES